MAALTDIQQEKADQIREFLRSVGADGKIFSVRFVKRSTGEVRDMVCRLGVTSKLKGGTKSFDDKEHRLLTVYDMQKQGYRSISLESVQQININGNLWQETTNG